MPDLIPTEAAHTDRCHRPLLATPSNKDRRNNPRDFHTKGSLEGISRGQSHHRRCCCLQCRQSCLCRRAGVARETLEFLSFSCAAPNTTTPGQKTRSAADKSAFEVQSRRTNYAGSVSTCNPSFRSPALGLSGHSDTPKPMLKGSVIFALSFSCINFLCYSPVFPIGMQI